jgi:hypothetical protein
MISVIVTPVKKIPCCIAETKVECSRNTESLQPAQVPDDRISTEQSCRSTSETNMECSGNVVPLQSEHAPDDRISVEQFHLSTNETLEECSGNAVSRQALHYRPSSTINSAEPESLLPLGTECKQLILNKSEAVADEVLCKSSAKVKMRLRHDRVALPLNLPSVASVLEECTFDLRLLSPIKDPPRSRKQNVNSVELKSEVSQLKSDVTREMPVLLMSSVSALPSSGTQQTKKRKSNSRANAEEEGASAAKKPCMVR